VIDRSANRAEDRGRWGSGLIGRFAFTLVLAAATASMAAIAACQPGRPADKTPQGAAKPAPRRLIALTPSLTETLFALGLGDRVVGVGDYSRWPPEVAQKPRLGGLFNANVERIAALHPDLAVLMPSERDLAAKLAPLGVDSLIVPIETLDDVERSFTAIAARCGVPARGERLRGEWRRGLAPLHPSGPPLKVMLSVGRDPGRLAEVTVAASHTFLDEILRRLGAVNAFADAPTRYPQVGLEEIVARQPDLILELRGDPLSPPAAETLVQEWRQLPQLRARRVEVLAADYVLVPGPRLPLLARDLEAALARARAAR
jgi:iron complex transport system substrate-binding protein